MKYLPLLLLTACIKQPMVQAPIVLTIQDVESPPPVELTAASDEEDKPTVFWRVNPIVPEELGIDHYFDETFENNSSFIFRRDTFIADFETTGNLLSLHCSGNQQLFECPREAAVLNAKCGDMLFSVTCSPVPQ